MLKFIVFDGCVEVYSSHAVGMGDVRIGTIQNGYFRPETYKQYSLDELKQLALKLEEFIKFGNDIPVCENCGGTPGFPKDDCVWGNHGLLAEN